MGAIVRVVEPFATSLHNETVEHFQTMEPAVEGADAVVLVTAHKQFRQLDFKSLKEKVRTPVFVDGRRIFDADQIISLGFTYRGTGWRSNN